MGGCNGQLWISYGEGALAPESPILTRRIVIPHLIRLHFGRWMDIVYIRCMQEVLEFRLTIAATQGALWQTVAYSFRIVSIANPTSLGDYAAWFVLILVICTPDLHRNC